MVSIRNHRRVPAGPAVKPDGARATETRKRKATVTAGIMVAADGAQLHTPLGGMPFFHRNRVKVHAETGGYRHGMIIHYKLKDGALLALVQYDYSPPPHYSPHWHSVMALEEDEDDEDDGL